ncbi:hypothetical protein BpHYR1_011983 [Brachionus plicatilis]|uniref:Uncharacterized protein n=1 Tax=Brachionus plicatilis TaxID=10195 RepID=A0A3M7S077_BRAPC|nr:hypothetical protein BpHYR1_011983 [Brachionus plicatilis]
MMAAFLAMVGILPMNGLTLVSSTVVPVLLRAIELGSGGRSRSCCHGDHGHRRARGLRATEAGGYWCCGARGRVGQLIFGDYGRPYAKNNCEKEHQHKYQCAELI